MSTADNVVEFEAKEGEQLIISATLKGADGAVANLTGATVTLTYRRRGTLTPVTLGGSTALVGAGTLGTVKYTGTVADTATTGEVEFDFTADYGSGRVQKFPDGKNSNLLGYVTPKIA